MRPPSEVALIAALLVGIVAVPAVPSATGAARDRSARVSRPRIVDDHIDYGRTRRRQMARYSGRHYGRRVWRLRHPRVIVLHFTGGPSYSSAWNTFQANAPNRGELPGVCAHYIVKKSGGIREIVPTDTRCRHAIGLNHRAIGIEMVQETGSGAHWADRQILQRRSQSGAAVKLVKWLKHKYSIKLHNVIGHAMANNSPFFKDLEGWSNTHTDWLWRDVKTFRRRVKRL